MDDNKLEVVNDVKDIKKETKDMLSNNKGEDKDE